MVSCERWMCCMYAAKRGVVVTDSTMYHIETTRGPVRGKTSGGVGRERENELIIEWSIVGARPV